MTLGPEAVLHVIDALNELGAPYMVTGSLARNLYCIPRSTIDADFVAELSAADFARLVARMREHFVEEAQMAFETVTGTLQHRFDDPETKFRIEIFDADMTDAHERSRFARRRSIEVNGRKTFVPTAEDIVVQKLRWFVRAHRPKDRKDIIELFEEQWQALDWTYIERWCTQHDSLEAMHALRAEVEQQLRERGEC